MINGVNEALGLPSNYKIAVKDALAISKRFSEATFGSEKPISKISFIYYYDKFGDFTKEKNHYDRIVNNMYKNLDANSRLDILVYLKTEEGK